MVSTAIAWVLLLFGTFAPATPAIRRAEIHFDTTGVEFGPWVRRYIRALNSSSAVRDASTSGRVLVTFHLHRDGTVSDIDLLNLTSVEEFATVALASVDAARVPLPPEYPEERARFVVTFIYNEAPATAAPPTKTSQGVASLQPATASEVERRIGRPTTARGALWRYSTSSGDFVLVFDDAMRVWMALPSDFDIAVLEK
jgi:hypothetical protein